MKYEKEYSVHEAATILTQFIDLYVDEDKLRKYGLLWNSLNDTVKRVCLNFSQVSALNFLSIWATEFYSSMMKENAHYAKSGGMRLSIFSILWSPGRKILIG